MSFMAPSAPPVQHVAALGPKYTTLGKNLYLSRGKDFGRQKEKSESEDPTIILIFGWMAAQLPHLQKYTKVYEDLYPEATKVVVRCEPAFFFTRTRTNEANLQPVQAVLEAEGCLHLSETAPNPRVLIHSFSNGGAAQLGTLGQILSTYPAKPLMSAIVIDSAPGRLRGTFIRGLNAFTAHIRNPILKALARVSMAFVFTFMAIVAKFRGRPHPIDVLNERLERPHVLPWVSKDSTPRLYIYSKEDSMIPAEHVEDHAELMGRQGHFVRTEKFSGTSHVNHARSDPARYWDAIGSLWAEAGKRFSTSQTNSS